MLFFNVKSKTGSVSRLYNVGNVIFLLVGFHVPLVKYKHQSINYYNICAKEVELNHSSVTKAIDIICFDIFFSRHTNRFVNYVLAKQSAVSLVFVTPTTCGESSPVSHGVVYLHSERHRVAK